MSFYTVGHRQNYRDAIAKYGRILKAQWGWVFDSHFHACLFLEQEGHVDDWAIWELVEMTEEDVISSENDFWGYLSRNVPIGKELEYEPSSKINCLH